MIGRQLPQYWTWKPIGEVAKVIPGFAFKSKDWTDQGIQVVKIKNIQSDTTVNMTEADCVPEEILTERLTKFLLLDGDILLAMTGATAGKVGKLRTKQRALLNQRVAKLVPVTVDEGFFWAVVSSQDYQDYFFKLADGAAQPNMSGGQIEKVAIPFPPLPTQQRIASILSTYDDLIENHTRRIAVLEEMARRLYEEWFVHFRFPGHEDATFTETEHGRVPEGWKMISLGEAADNYDRRRKPLSKMQRAERQGPYPYYGAAKIFDYIDDYIFDGRYLLLAEDGSVITKEGHPILQMVSGKFWPNNHTHILQGKGHHSTEFLYLALKEYPIAGHVTGAAQPKITQANMNRIPLLSGSEEVHREFDDVIGPMFRLMENIGKKTINLRTQRDLLLPKLVSGEIDVSEAKETLENAVA